MSWQVASFAVLGAVLVGGFAWYERLRPPSQIVALVAALAALAVAGRVALAPIPNVVATTDVAIFSGYALGAAPGFTVGALAGLVSNFWLGQGPWTPWQMAGWGLAGALGALLARATRRRAGRLELTAACGLAGIAYGALLNFSLMVSYGGEFTFARWLTLEGRAVPFDLAHAIGNMTLALLAGPAIVRMLVRFRERFAFRWKGAPDAAPVRRGVAGAASAVLVLVAASSALVATSQLVTEPAAARGPAAAWLQGAQNRDGGFPASPGQRSSTELTGWAMLGLEAARINPLDQRTGRSPVAYLRRHAAELRSAGDLARTILALRGAGVDARRFAGRDLVAALARMRRANGSYQGWPNSTAFAVMALRASGAGTSPRSLAWLRRVQAGDGGWGAVPGAASDPDSTGAVLQAFGEGSRASRRGVRFLRQTQGRNGGWALTASGAANSQSTAWALQGLLAAGVDPASVRRSGRSGLDYLAARRAADGHYRYSSSSDQTPVWVTGQVLVAANLKAFPLAPVPRAGGRGDGAAHPANGQGGGAHEEGGGGAPSERTQRERGRRSARSGGGRSSESRVREGPPAATRGRVAESRPVSAGVDASEDDDGGSSPLAPIAIGILVGGAVAGGAWLAARRLSPGA